jgi:hypothetical protein
VRDKVLKTNSAKDKAVGNKNKKEREEEEEGGVGGR